MLRKILSYGTLAGLFIGGIVCTAVAAGGHRSSLASSMAFAYVVMLVGLSAVFVAIKRHRDQELGGVIGFWRAFGLGLGISVVAGVLHAVAWEATLAITHLDFITGYANAVIAEEKAKGASAEAIAQVTAQMEAMKAQYANPLYRMPMTFIEVFPVGLLVTLVSAGLLRNRGFLPAR